MSERYVIGVDGGGTKTHVLLVALDGEVVCEVRGGPSNLSVEGIPQTARVLVDLIGECCQKAGCSPDVLQSVVMGLAGAGRAADRAELIDSIYALGQERHFTLRNMTIDTDARIALEAAFAGGPGVVVVAGTGSIVLYRSEDHQLLRAGGWGRILGDEGGAYSMAREGLRAVMREYDGRGEKTDLTKKAKDHFRLSNIEELIQKVYFQNTDLASFAPKVLEAVIERDRIAYHIMMEQANLLVEHVRSLAMKIPPMKKLPVALMGSLIEHDNPYAKMVGERIHASLPQLLIQKPKFPAAYGAVILALNAFK